MVYSADANYLLLGLQTVNKEKIKLLDISKGVCIKNFNTHSNAISSIHISIDGKWIIAVGSDQTLKIIDINLGDLVFVQRNVTSAFLVDLDTIVCFTPDNKLKVYKIIKK